MVKLPVKRIFTRKTRGSKCESISVVQVLQSGLFNINKVSYINIIFSRFFALVLNLYSAACVTTTSLFKYFITSFCIAWSLLRDPCLYAVFFTNHSTYRHSFRISTFFNHSTLNPGKPSTVSGNVRSTFFLNIWPTIL
jgi:hypothetical protein